MKRRHFVIGSSVLGLAAVLGLKPQDAGAVYSSYFSGLNQQLREHGPGRPVMIVDLNVLQKNIATLKQHIRPGVDYRIVVKSLPSPQLLDYIMQSANTNKLMVFHQPFLNHIAASFPSADVLLGKPLPISSVALFYRQLDRRSAFDPSRQLQWLIDTPQRLQQYQQLAQQLGIKMRINAEIDVGLHRGGLQSPAELKILLTRILANPRHLEFAGLMGYDPHVVKLPAIVKSVEQAFAESQSIYQSYLDLMVQEFPSIPIAGLCLNGAGSPTVALHEHGSVINDISAGSCLVKPTDFDMKTLNDFVPAAYIATPVLKKMSATTLPGIEPASSFLSWWDANLQQTFFIYGGKWMADYESPAGLRGNALFGASTNQQIVNASARVKLDVDDHIFLRPHQSEAVFLQFGDLLTVREGNIVDRWAVLNQ